MNRRRDPDREAGERRRIIRRATAWTVGLWLLTVAVALGGAALIAWGLAAFGGLPFVPTWLILAAFVLIVPLAATAARAYLNRGGNGADG